MFESIFGVAMIGVVNLTVSFTLALWVALRGNGLYLAAARPVLKGLGERRKSEPARFFIPQSQPSGSGP